MNCKALTLFAAAALAGAVASARADTVLDGNLVSLNGTGTPTGWYDGSENPNSSFTVVTENGIELGLGAMLLQNGSAINPTGNTYTVPNSAETTAASGSVLPNSNGAAWNYEFLINLRPSGVGSLTLANVENANTNLTITDLTTPATWTINPLTYLTEALTYDNSATATPFSIADLAAPGSQNPAFASAPLPGGYKLNNTDNYRITFNVGTAAGALASDTINVDVASTPLPASVTMGLVLLGGLFVVSKRRAASVIA